MAPVKMDLLYHGGDDCGNLIRHERHGLHPIILRDLLSKLSFRVNEPPKQPKSHIAQKSDGGAA
jgi:hypothetical protein